MIGDAGMMGCSMSGMWLFGGLSLVLIVGILGAGVWAATRTFRRPSGDAKSVLEQRFARGEIGRRVRGATRDHGGTEMRQSKAWLAVMVVLPLLAVACTNDDSSQADSSGGLAVEEPAPDFTLPSAQGSNVSLSDFKGKPVLLYFSMGPG